MSGSKYNTERIRAALLDGLSQDHTNDAGPLRDVVFHMTDWLEEFAQWEAFCSDPGSYSSEEIEEMVTRFLVHVPNHLAAAGKLFLGYPVADIFGVGALSENGTNECDS